MDPSKTLEFIQDLLTWETHRAAAFITGLVIGFMFALGVAGLIFRILSNRRSADDHQLIDGLQKDKDRLQVNVEDRHQQNLELTGDLKVAREKLGRAKAEMEAKKQELARWTQQSETLGEECKKREVVIRQLHDWRRQSELRLQSDASQLAQAHQAVHHLKADQQNLVADRQTRERESAFLKQNVAELAAECERLREEGVTLELSRNEAAERLAIAEAEIAQLREEVEESTNHIDAIANSDGRVWEQPVTCPVPPKQRHPVVISILNLKGGVGKTTITANLGATLMMQGHKVLLVDLDYQGSLTALCLPTQAITDLRRTRRFVHNLLEGNGRGHDALWEIAARIEDPHPGYILPANDELADAEMRLLSRWLLRNGEDDARFALRHTLHDARLQDQFDFILLDCPPRLTAACINALTSSDHVLIPTLLDKVSADAVPRLLKWLHQLNQRLHLDLSILGVLANRISVYKGKPIAVQKDLWKHLPAQCQDAWGQPVHHFAAQVPHDRVIAEAASRNKFAVSNAGLEAVFKDIANEMRRRLPHHEGSRASAVS